MMGDSSSARSALHQSPIRQSRRVCSAHRISQSSSSDQARLARACMRWQRRTRVMVPYRALRQHAALTPRTCTSRESRVASLVLLWVRLWGSPRQGCACTCVGCVTQSEVKSSGPLRAAVDFSGVRRGRNRTAKSPKLTRLGRRTNLCTSRGVRTSLFRLFGRVRSSRIIE